jgi:hypothetical protein
LKRKKKRKDNRLGASKFGHLNKELTSTTSSGVNQAGVWRLNIKKKSGGEGETKQQAEHEIGPSTDMWNEWGSEQSCLGWWTYKLRRNQSCLHFYKKPTEITSRRERRKNKKWEPGISMTLASSTTQYSA